MVSVDELQNSVETSKDVKVKTQEPPLTTQTTRLLVLPPSSPPKVVIDALQVPSIVAGEDTRKLVQLAGTPLAKVIEGEKQSEEKEEARDEEESAIQTLVELPKIGTPTKTL